MLNEQNTRQYLKESNFENLFTQELGWDHHTQILNITVDETEYTLTAIAEKRGMVVFECPATAADGEVFFPDKGGRGVTHIPDYSTRRKIQKQVAKSVHEHFIIYTDAEKTIDIYQWVKREQGKPDACREHRYNRDEQSGDSLIQKLQNIAFTFEEEENLSLIDVTGRVGTAFYAERVTKKFYDRFKKEHDAFLKFLKGIPDAEMQKWYVSVMLNRLMFIYFIQKKSFLDNDADYLRTKLTESQTNGTNRYYKEFLCPLFFEGFAKPENERSREMKRLLGKIPYLNGGIFQQHQLETLHGKNIEIPDTAFEQIFNFFEQYDWHLDDRPLRNDNEINPDVLGYIFEKYINQKQMGAYYTKEDITEYISKNTIIPFLFDKARKACKIAFEGDASVWNLLQEDPDRYIYDAVKKGVEAELPPEIAVGIDDVSKRTDWNTPAPEEYALPTEIWRETVARRQRYETVRSKLANGDVRDINDLITYNLNIRQFAQDVIENCEGPELLRAFWKAITEVTILDPTCGSGAFLFAALNILEPLYEACLDRMQVFLDEMVTVSPLIRGTEGLGTVSSQIRGAEELGTVSAQIRGTEGLGTVSPLIRGAGGLGDAPKKPNSRRYSDFRELLDRIDQHPNREYFVLKSIIINNLYGVDIMDEAVEICKLRLFLKMVAQIQDVRRIEPLPDIDFNVQAGNTLVGFATYQQVENAVTGRLDFNNTMKRIKEKAEDVEHLFDRFREQQTELGGTVTPADKQVLQHKLQVLENELNTYLAGEYNIDPSKKTNYQCWLDSHKPFHWFIAFYGILKDGGFDVIIGNPPYVEYSKVKKQYAVMGYKTEKCGNLYAMSIERSFDLSKGPVGMIVQLPLVCTDRMIPAQSLFKDRNRKSWFANFDDRPGKLFDDLQHIRATIFLSTTENDQDMAMLYATKYNRWFTEVRSILFEGIVYKDITDICAEGAFPKIADSVEKSIVNKLKNANKSVSSFKTGKFACYFHNSPQYWIRATDFVPYFWNERDGKKQSLQIKDLHFTNKNLALAVCCLLNSSLFYWWFIVSSDCRHLNIREIVNFSFNPEKMDQTGIIQLSEIAEELMVDYRYHSNRKETSYKTTGKVVYDEFFPRHSKPIIDKIDRVLAKHYGFTDEELDFIINYDIKYRMGLGN